MNQYPEKTCEIDRLIRHPKSVQAAKASRKTQQRRNGIYGYPGETFELEGVTFSITALERQALGEMTETDAQAEGYPNLAVYKELILKMHPGMNWEAGGLVWVHHFARQD